MSFLELYAKFDAYLQGDIPKGLYESLDKESFAKLCKEKDELERKPLLPEPDTLIPLPEEEEGGTLDLESFRCTSWFDSIAEEAGKDKALLHFNVQKRLKQYCELAKDEVQGLTGAFLLAVKFVVKNEKDIADVEASARYYDEVQPDLWMPSTAREKFKDDNGKRKFNVLCTFLVDVTDPRNLLYSLAMLLYCPHMSEKLQVMDFYNYSMLSESRGSVEKKKLWTDVVKHGSAR